MATGRPRILPLGLALATLMPLGCSSPGPLASRQSMVGGLKASVSQLEFENEKLRKEVGELKVDNSRLDNQLAQEREANGEIAARLDDAKDLIRRQGGNAQASLGATSRSYEDDIPPPVATPRSRKVKGGRTSPTVRIPPPEFPSSSNDDDLSYLPPARRTRDAGPDVDNEADVWLPVARGLPSQATTRR